MLLTGSPLVLSFINKEPNFSNLHFSKRTSIGTFILTSFLVSYRCIYSDKLTKHFVEANIIYIGISIKKY